MNDEGEIITSQRELARRLGKSNSTVSEWTKLGEWPFGPGPWSVDELDEITEWSEERTGDTAHRDDGFYRLRVRYPQPPRLSEEDCVYILKDLADMPREIVTAQELDILSGKVELTPEQARKVVERFARYRAHITEMCFWIPQWLVGFDAKEIGYRLRSEICCRNGGIAETWNRTKRKGKK